MAANNTHLIKSVSSDSPAARAGIVPGDILLAINGHELKDIFDYHFYSDDSNLAITILHKNTSQSICHVQKEEGEDLGLIFENGLMDNYRSCHNKCIFCFIDQMPPGMRETLYFKDDDTRLSFLQGNYVTLTNMKKEDIERIISYHLAPINISVHTTNPTLRCQMLNNRFAGDILEKIRMLYEAEIPMNSQIVLCKNINDGAELDRTIRELLDFAPYMQSLSVVPVGLSKYREGLYPLEAFDKQDAIRVIELIEKWQNIAMERFGIHFVQASDEWYLLAGKPLPEADSYDGYIQLENGVGMMRLLEEEVMATLKKSKSPLFVKKQKISIATGMLAYDMVKRLASVVKSKYPKIAINVYPIRNDFFGEKITVSGLICGQDLIKQLREHNLGERLLLPVNMLRSQEQIFLDDVSVQDVSLALQVPVTIVKSSGADFVNAIINKRG